MVADETSGISLDEQAVDIPMDKEVTDISMDKEVTDILMDKEVTDIPMDKETVVDIKPPPQRSKQLDVGITTEYSTTPKCETKVLSRYLRTSSLASCHDLCKSGHEHYSDEKPRTSLSKTIRIRLAEMRNHHKTIDLDPKRKEIVKSPKSFPESKDKYQKKIHQEVLPSPLKLVVLLQKDPLPRKKRPNISEKSSSDLKATTKQVPTKLRFTIRSNSHATAVAPPLPVKRFVGTVTGMHKKQLNTWLQKNQKIARKSDEITKQFNRSVSSTKAKSKENSHNAVTIASPPSKEKKRKIINATCGNCFTQQSPPRKGNMKFDKTLIQMSNSNTESRSSNGMDMGLEAADSTRKLNFNRENVVNSPIEINTGPSKIMFHLTKVLDENSYEKNDTTRSSLNKSVTDELDSSSAEEQPKQVIEENGEEKEINEKKREEMNEEKGAAILSNIDEPKDKVDSSRKLMFKEGKIIDNNQPENISPRRLKFKPSRVINDCQDTKVHMKISGLKSKFINKLDDGVNVKNREEVILKHRLVEGKRNSQSLFNNVIEETANKLVESRKGKVKALVGAFESVISLQDTKPLPTANSS